MQIQEVQDYLKEDRQWPRHLRIAHAKMQLNKCAKLDEFGENQAFWHAVLDANGTLAETDNRKYFR